VSNGNSVDLRAWWGCCESDPSATFFATPEWSRILTEAFPAFHPKPYLFTFGGRYRTVVPAIEVRRLFGRLSALHSMPFGTYGGPVGAIPPGDGLADAILTHLSADGCGRFQTTVFPNPLGSPLPTPLAAGSDYVHAPDLGNGFEAWWNALDDRTRYHIRKSERRGVDVRTGMTAERFEAFFNIHRWQSRSWDPPTLLGPRFFRALWEARSPRMELWSAHHEGRLVAGVVAFRWGKQMTPFLSAIHPDARAIAPTNLVYARLIEACCREGWTSFSFLGSGSKPGVERFKRSMGGHRRDFRYVDLQGPAHVVAHNPVAARVRRLGTRLTGIREVRSAARLRGAR